MIKIWIEIQHDDGKPHGVGVQVENDASEELVERALETQKQVAARHIRDARASVPPTVKVTL